MFHYMFRTLEMTLNNNLNANNVFGTPSGTSYIVGFGLAEMAILSIPNPTICSGVQKGAAFHHH